MRAAGCGGSGGVGGLRGAGPGRGCWWTRSGARWAAAGCSGAVPCSLPCPFALCCAVPPPRLLERFFVVFFFLFFFSPWPLGSVVWLQSGYSPAQRSSLLKLFALRFLLESVFNKRAVPPLRALGTAVSRVSAASLCLVQSQQAAVRAAGSC